MTDEKLIEMLIHMIRRSDSQINAAVHARRLICGMMDDHRDLLAAFEDAIDSELGLDPDSIDR